MERKLGEVFTYKDKTYKVIKGCGCTGCSFVNRCYNFLYKIHGSCSNIYRQDNISVVFKEINDMKIENNQLTIEIPEGMEIDTENSSLAEGIIKFKPKYITYSKIINSFNSITNTNVYIHSSDTKALKAIAHLMNIARYYNGDWKPDWNNPNEYKYFIVYNCNIYKVDYNWTSIYDRIYFKNKKDAQSVIDNPNFRTILNIIYKN